MDNLPKSKVKNEEIPLMVGKTIKATSEIASKVGRSLLTSNGAMFEQVVLDMAFLVVNDR